MCWGGRSRRFCLSVMAQGPGLGRVCGPSISKVKSRARPRGGQDLPPHWRGDHHGNCAAELGAGLSTGLRTERCLPAGTPPCGSKSGGLLHLIPPPVSSAPLVLWLGARPLRKILWLSVRGLLCHTARKRGISWGLWVCFLVVSLRVIQVLSLVESFKKATNELTYKIETQLSRCRK